MKTKLFLTLIMAVLTSIGFAQVSGYVFGYTAETYSEITGGTVLGTAEVNGGINVSLDSSFYPATPIPFPFYYNGLPYTETAVSADGYILMGGITTVGYTPVSNTAVDEGVIAALGRDLQGNVDAGNLGQIRYQTLGDAPDRTFVVQWKNFRRYAGVNEDYNFQIRLHETTNVIEFVYGEMVVTYTGTTHAQVGLRGATNADYVNRAVSTNWAASTAGTTNVAICTLSSTVYPASGTTYSYSVTVSTPPNPTTLVYPAVNGWAYTDGVLKWTNNGGYPSSFNVYFGETASPPYVANVTTLSYAPVLAPNTTYFWKIEPQNSFGGATGTVWSFKTPTATQLAESFENTNFPPVGWLNPNTWSRSTTNPYHLTAVASKSASTTPAVLSTPKVTITASSTLDYYYKPGSSNGYGRLQVVYSPDRVSWTPIGPLISMVTTTTVWYSQSVDLSTIQGNYFLGFQVYTTTSTATIAIDHVFGPEITSEAPGPVTLALPADLATDVSPLPTFTWNAPTNGGVPTGYKVYCDTSSNPTTLLTTTSDYTYTAVAQLAYNTPYYWKVVAYNGVGDSVANPVNSFTTWADPTVHAFPWSESFDGTTFAPIGWSNIKTAGTTLPGIWNRMTTGSNPTCSPHSGAAMARFNAYSIQTGGKAELITPPIDVPDGGLYKVKFWMFRDSGYATKPLEVVNVYVNTLPTSVGGTLLGTVSRYYGFAPIEATANLWYPYSFAFSGTSADKYVIFEGVSEYGNNIFVDDVSVQVVDPPAPPNLTYPASSSVGLPQEGFNFTWTPDLVNGDAPAYYVLFVATSEETIYDEYAYYDIFTTSFNPSTALVDPINFAYGIQYFWTVQAVNSSGDAVADPIRHFTIEIGPPIVTISINAGNVLLDWSPGSLGATSYQVQSSDFPDGPWFNELTPPGLTWTGTGTATNRKFYKVKAIQ